MVRTCFGAHSIDEVCIKGVVIVVGAGLNVTMGAVINVGEFKGVDTSVLHLSDS